MRLLHFKSQRLPAGLVNFCRSADPAPEIAFAVAGILADVRQRGDAAVAHYAAKFDGAKLGPRNFRVRPAELVAALRQLPAAQLRALRAAHAGITAYHRHGRPAAWRGRNPQGALIGEKFDPIRRVGIYVPGGQAPLVSTVLMTVTLAKIAGCPEIAVFTPTDNRGQVNPAVLAALQLLGVREVYRIGGVQAVAAMAFGTETIPAVDKIFGPGNAYVCEAKRQVFGTVGVDALPGPSEVMIIADATARPDFAAADLLAQAEHGSGRERIYLVATSVAIVRAVQVELEVQLATLPRAAQARRVLADGFLAIVVDQLDRAAAVANYVAPEHLELMVKPSSAARLTKDITTAGAIMLGNDTPTALGDFTAGPSHVLPTGRTGRFSSGLRLADFMRRTSLVGYDRRSVRLGNRVVAAFADMEQLQAHGRSVALRVE